MNRRVRRWPRLALGMMLALCGAGAATPPTSGLKPFEYHYDVSWGAVGIGTLDLSLQPWTGHAGCYRYATTTHPNAVVRLLYGAPSQTSWFCLRDGRIRSRRFVSTLPGDARQSYTLTFDWKAHTVTDSRGRTRSIPDDAIDSLALQQAVRRWVLAHPGAGTDQIARFTMVDDKNLTHYRFRLDGRRTVDTPAGRFETLLMQRIDNPDKVGRFWLAPTRDDMPVKTETRNGGKPAVTMVLAK